MALSKDTYNLYCRIVDTWFINGQNDRQAVLSICPNKSDSAADKYWQRLSKNVQVQDYIKSKHEKASKILEISHEDMLNALKLIKDADSTEILAKDVDSLKLLPLEIKQILNIKVVKTGDNEKVEVSFMDKAKAYEMIAKHIGFYEKDHEQQKEGIKLVGFGDLREMLGLDKE